MKTHYLLVHSEASESDEAVEEIACGLTSVNSYTQYESQVTCKNCRKIIESSVINNLLSSIASRGVFTKQELEDLWRKSKGNFWSTVRGEY